MTDTAIDPQAPPADRRQTLLAAIRRTGGTWTRTRAWELYSPRPEPKFVRRDLQRLCLDGALTRVGQGQYQAAGVTAELVAFLRARLDEDEQTARAASGGTLVGSRGAWSPSPAGDEWEASRGLEGGEELLVALRLELSRPPDTRTGLWGAMFSNRQHADPGAWSPMSTFRHAARHDPARVVADVAAKRRILDLHSPVTLRGGAGAKYFDTTTVCRSCEPPQFPEHAFPCPTLRLLALPYRDHSDYQPEWAPDA